MGEKITIEDVCTMKLTPASKLKLLEWIRMDQMRKAYLASVRAEVAKGEETR